VDNTSIPDTIRLNPAPAEGAVPYTITNGTVYWSAKKAIGIAHNGEIPIASGELMVNQGQVLSGNVAFDIASIAVTNMDDPRDKATLESHLKDNDFFNVKKYPEASFNVTETLPSSQPAFNWIIRGKLNIKDQSNPVNVPVRIWITDSGLRAESVSFIINRTKWGINFRSGILGTAKDQIIEDVVTLSFKLEAKPSGQESPKS
jgi:polyisoprenoid-binding protein YceI